MNPWNNKRALFNFFKPHLPIKAEQTYPATCKGLPSSEFHRKRARFQSGWRGVEGGAYGTNENFTLTGIIKSTPPKQWSCSSPPCFLWAFARHSRRVEHILKLFILCLCFVACWFFSGGIMRCRFKELSNVLLSEVNRIVVGCLQPDPDGCEGKRVKARDQTGDICPPALLQERRKTKRI